MIKKSFVESEISNSVKELTKLKSELPKKPKGHIAIRTYNSGKKAVVYHYFDSSHKFIRITLNPAIPKDLELARKIIKYYKILQQIHSLEEYISALSSFKTILPDNNINPIFINTENIFNIKNSYAAKKNTLWNTFKERQNTNFEENLKFAGNNGYYRSKSEASISTALARYEIPYKYEIQLNIRNKTIYPDFTLLTPIKENIVIWEHLGRMDDISYNKKAKSKIDLYESQGYYINKNLILTYETLENPFTTEDIDYIIHLIRYM